MMVEPTQDGESIGSDPHVDDDARQPIRTAQDFTAAMLESVRELNRNEDLRREVAKRIS